MRPSALDALYYLDPDTGQPRGSAPTALGRDTWDSGRGAFLERVAEAGGCRVQLDAALDSLRRPRRAEVGYFAVGDVVDAEGSFAVYSLHGGRHGVNLWEQVGTTIVNAAPLLVHPLPADSPRVFWWASEGDYTRYRQIKYVSAA